MKALIISITLILFFFSNCSETGGVGVGEKKTDTIKPCPCDTFYNFKKGNDNHTKCLLGNSLIETKIKNDTVEVVRYWTRDTIWHVQEYIVVANNKIIYPELAYYCNFEETSKYYKITFIRNEFLRIGKKGPFVKNLLGCYAIIGTDTISSKDTTILIPKKRFKGVIKVEKKMNAVVNESNGVFTAKIIIEAENMIKYGNLLEQYKAIDRLCNTAVDNKK